MPPVDTKAAAPAAAPVAAVATPSPKPGTRIAPQITEIRSDVPMPEPTKGNRGSKSQYDFDKLEVGQSFGIKNKTAREMSSIVSNANRKNQADKRDAAGNVVFKTKTVTDQAGNKVVVPTLDPEKVALKVFFAADTNPKTDPDGASVRIFRKQ